MDIYEFLTQQAVMHGPSGHEYETAAWFKTLFEPLCDSVTIDPLYNVIALKRATIPTADGSRAPRVMLAAHQDEIALMVADILPDGTLRLGMVGSVDPRILPASVVTVHARTGENGYVAAVNGRGVTVTGGGVAQVASAIWLAIKNCDGIAVAEKSTYGSKYNQSYVASSSDAILVDYSSSRDFSFRNTGDAPLTICTYIAAGELVCEIYRD